MSNAGNINYFMRSIQIKEQHEFSELAGTYNVTHAQARTLGYIDKNAGTNQRQIADHFNLRGASVSSMIKNLESRGFLEKKASTGTQDRSNKIYLTDSGHDLVGKLNDLFYDVENKITQNLSNDEALKLVELLEKIEKSM